MTSPPGPWRIVDGRIVDADGNLILAHVAITDFTGSAVMAFVREDAVPLIAAAPALLASLKALLAQVHADCMREGEEAAVEAAEALVADLDG